MKFIKRKRKGTMIEMSPVNASEAVSLMQSGEVSFSETDKNWVKSLNPNMEAGWIARDPNDKNDMWFINIDFSSQNYCFDDDLSFGEALDYMKVGHLAYRKGWNGKGMFIFLVNGSRFKVNRPPLNEIFEEDTEINYLPHIDMKTADGSIVPWLASQTDILAEDWEIIQPKQ